MRVNLKLLCTAMLLAGTVFTWAQEKNISGQVTDSFGFPVTDAFVHVEGSENGVYTDADGNYDLSVNEGDVLVIEYIGLETQTIAVGDANTYSVQLTEGGAIDVGTVIVEGALGIQRKADAVTSAYEVVDSEELNQASSPNAVQALQGKVSGLQINTVSSGVESDNRVVFRGGRSITGNNEALVVIDGSISNLATLSQIPPESIKSINALKGLQGAALYGSDGVNGVIIVTTLQGTRSGDLEIQIKSSLDVSSIAYLPERQLRYGQGWDGEHYTQENGSWGPEFDGSMQPIGYPQADGSYIIAPYSPIKDNYKDFFKNGTLSQNTVSISTGNLEDGYVIGTYTNTINNFVVKDDKLLRNSFLAKAGKKFGKWTLESNVNYITQSLRQASSGLYGSLLQTPSNIPVSAFENSGNEGHWNAYYMNPYWERENDRQKRNLERFTGSLTLGYDVNDHISISYLANIRNVASRSIYYVNENIDPIVASRNVSAEFLNSNSLSRRYYGDLMVNFNYDLSDNLSLQANVGHNYQDNFFSISEAGGQNFENPGIYNFSNVLQPYTASQRTLAGRLLANYWTRSNKFGVFANVDLGFKDYLYLNMTARNDWSSVLDPENSSFFYPSAGISFIPTKAFPSIYSRQGLSYAKLSFNATRVGNDTGVSAYEINRLASLGIGYPMSESNSYVEGLYVTNPLIKPEFVTNIEGTVNLGFFNDRMTIDASIYKSTTSDLITSYSPSTASGAFRIKDNVGELETTGYELDLGFTPILSEDKNIRWDLTANISQYKIMINKLSTDTEGEQVALRTPYSWVGIYAQVGEEYPLIKGSAYERDEWGRIIVDANGTPNKINDQILGKALPEYIIGLNSSLKIHGFKISATMDYRGGSDYKFYSDVKRNLAWTGQLIESAENRSGFIMPNSSFDYNGDGVIQEDEGNSNVVTGSSYPAFLNYYSNDYAQTGENLVIDASAFKLREVAVSYTLGESILKGTGISELTLGVNARNPLTILSSQNRGYNDPETSETSGNASGLAFTNRYPTQSYYGGSINIKF
ncbi:SusC/RagA family TonB-linked outer membrane protein [Flavobacteriaceae bacterium Ap0902]|nr:SusC/RagA family TonB-linked outer membrane protein [Flavobacteriaceae bacterium Ap0902]